MAEVTAVADGSVLTSAIWDEVRTKVVVPCLSSGRPTGVEGRLIYETDTDRLLAYDGTNWYILAEPTQTYTPTFTNCSGGTATGFYKRRDGWIDVVAIYTFAGAGVAGTVTVSLPETMEDALRFAGGCQLFDANVGTYPGGISSSTTTALNVWAFSASGTYLAYAALSSTVPFTWATTDAIYVSVRYQMDNRYD
jgi:hypothetical protein